MAALNKAETENLCNVMRLLDHISRQGYDPKDKEQKGVGGAIGNARKLINSVVMMKGYSPSRK